MEKKRILLGVVMILLLALGYVTYLSFQNSAPQNTIPAIQNTTQPMMPESSVNEVTDSAAQISNSRYVTLQDVKFPSALSKKIANAGNLKLVYFFQSLSCPDCKRIDQELRQNLARIPQDVLVIKTDFETELDLKKQYAATSSPTFVWVNNTGKQIKKWTSGGITELIRNTR